MGFDRCYSCFWWETGACNGQDSICEKYVGFDNLENRKLYNEYDADCVEALASVTEKWKERFKEYEI